MEALRRIYEEYGQKLARVKAQASPASGLFGTYSEVKNAPCHQEFYDGVGAWVEAFLQTGPDEEAVFRAAEWILRGAEGREDPWFYIAAQGHALALIPLLSPAHRQQLLLRYGEAYPRHMRLPVQREIWKALKKK